MAEQSFSIPLTRVSRGRRRQRISQAANVDTPLIDVDEIAYLVPLSIGGQTFSVAVDTGSSDLWVVSSECSSEDCSAVQRFDSLKSITLSQTDEAFRLRYLLGGVEGKVVHEQIILGKYEIPSQVIGLADETESMGLADTGNSGVAGFAFASTASISSRLGTPLLQSLFNGLPEDRRYFSIKLGRQTPSTDIDTESSITIGQLSNDTSKPLSCLPVSRAGSSDYDFWKLELSHLILANTEFPLSPSSLPGSDSPIAVLDTGTTLLLGPTHDVDRFWESFGPATAKKDPDSDEWLVLCKTAPTVSIVLGSDGNQLEVPIHPRDMSWDEIDNAGVWCTGGMQASDDVNSGDWLFGDTFLRNVETTHFGANSTSPPQICLYPTTNFTLALQQFRAERGPESSPFTVIRARGEVADTTVPHATAVYTLSSICGFVLGGLFTMLFCLVRRTQNDTAERHNRQYRIVSHRLYSDDVNSDK